MPDPIYPTSGPFQTNGDDRSSRQQDAAIALIRQKIDNLYTEEPDAKQEMRQAEQHTHPGSKHQQYMNRLHASGKSLAEIQTAWHAYYGALPDNEKYEVWQEFYVRSGTTAQPIAAMPEHSEAQAQAASQTAAEAHSAVGAQAQSAQPEIHAINSQVQSGPTTTHPVHRTKAKPIHQLTPRGRHFHRVTKHVKKVNDVIKAAATTTDETGKRRIVKRHHAHSLLFGLACGTIAVFIFLFSFFNEYIIAPFIQPSRRSNDTPVIVDVASTVVSGGPKVIIPKINLEIPVDYSQKTTDEKAIELALDNGVVHYPTTAKPGEAGNSAFFGHSSNNIFNPGKYKFAFVLLHELVEGDIFYLNSGGTTYAYKVFSKRIVEPTEVGVLGPVAGKTTTATLITCDPPGTSLHRLVVVGEQISPDPSGNNQAPTPTTPVVETATTTPDLPGNGPTLWSRLWNSVF